jgi:hypothetical protein
MKNLVLFSVVMLSFFNSLSQKKGLGTNDPEAKKILDAVSAKFKSFKGVEAKFSLKCENASGKSLFDKTGTVYMKGAKYKINITGQEIFCDGSNVSTYDKASNEITITKLDPSSGAITPQKLFTNFYDKDFLYKLNGDLAVGTKKFKEIELTPTDKSKAFFKVLLYIDMATQTISSTKLFEKTGNRYIYAVTGFNGSSAIADSKFVLDAKKYPGVEVVDLR